ncbi:ATP-binding protein, partial [Reyranella soli]|uniref:ATP-binding protein n=1 Tax=Reyranella soli TaxID=1230389 RepID=UPI0011BE9D21
MAQDAQSSIGAPDTYTPEHLAHKILNSKAALEGERKQVTVLFADLKGSTELLAHRDPEEARKLLDPILDHMMEAVHHYEGIVNQAAGDGIMALFGAPLAHEDHAVCACFAALRMQERVKRHAEEVFHAYGVNLQIRVGLNSGEVVVGTIRSDLRMDYTAVGRTTHLAARMEQLASPGSILLTPSTLRLAEGLAMTRSLGPVPVKGLAEPLELYELTGAGPARTRFQAVARRGLTRFVGRDAELEQLRAARQLAGDGQGQIVTLIADAGIGKSRLVYELTHSHSVETWLVLECGAVSYGKAMSYLPVVNLLKSYFKIQDQDSLQAIRDKVTDKLLALDPALEEALIALLALLDLPVKDAAWQALDPAQRRQRTLDAVRRLLLRIAREQPVVLVFEDLHWIDGETQALLDGLVEDLGATRILLLATYRPEYRHGWSSKPHYGEISLGALPTDSARELLDALLGYDPGTAPLKERLLDLGTPFYLEEAVRTLMETKALEGSLGLYRPTRPVEVIEVPASVQVMLAARIDRLSAEDKRLLQLAAVIGKQIPLPLLRAVAELPDEALRHSLDRLQSADFLYETDLVSDREYNFKHSLTQDVAYGSLLQQHRRELHARIFAAIERLHHNRFGEQVELLAHHALSGDLLEKAVLYLFEAGKKASRHSAHQSALSWYDQALNALERLPHSRLKLEQGFDIRLHINAALGRSGEPREAVQRLQEAADLAEKLNDEIRSGRVDVLLAVHNCRSGQLDEALSNTSRALRIADRLSDRALLSMANAILENVHYERAEYERVVSLANGNLAVEVEHSYWIERHLGSFHNRYWLVRSLAELGRFTEAAAHSQETLRLAVPTENFALGVVHHGEGWRLVAKGDWARAR